MHRHLELVKAIQPKNPSVSDMDIIFSQALLMDAGSTTLKAIKSGEIADILAGLVALAYAAVQALAMRDEDIVENQDQIRPAYQMLKITRLLSEAIHHCTSGDSNHYSVLYHLCAGLASNFINADFDKAFQAYHEWHKTHQINDTTKPQKTIKPLDLTDYLYE